MSLKLNLGTWSSFFRKDKFLGVKWLDFKGFASFKAFETLFLKCFLVGLYPFTPLLVVVFSGRWPTPKSSYFWSILLVNFNHSVLSCVSMIPVTNKTKHKHKNLRMKSKVESSKLLDNLSVNSLFKVLLFWNQLDDFDSPQVVIVIFQWALNFWKYDNAHSPKDFEKENNNTGESKHNSLFWKS